MTSKTKSSKKKKTKKEVEKKRRAQRKTENLERIKEEKVTQEDFFNKEGRKSKKEREMNKERRKTRITKKGNKEWNKRRKTWKNNIIVSVIWSHLQQTLRVDQTCYWCCRLWCRLLSTIASCSSHQLQVNWISSARILSFRPRHSVDCNSCSTTFKKHCNTACEWWRVRMNSDSLWLSKSWELFIDPAIHNAYHTPLHSVTICLVRIQMCSARHAEDKEGSDKLSWEQTLIRVWALIQIRVSCTSRQTRIAHYA